MDLCNLNDIRALLTRHDFHFSKAKGQNFLIDGSIPAAIAEASGADETCTVLEIGPGIGCLTACLAHRAGAVVSVELDRTLLPVLEETMQQYNNVTILPGDILKTDLPALVAEHFGGRTPIVCANLPYNITTPALSALIDSKCFERITVMIQKEVAQRICARPGTAEFGAFSLYMQYYTVAELLFDVPPECFVPAPKVTSAVVRCTLRQEPPVDVSDVALFFRVIRASFAMRRKTLVNGLFSVFGADLSKAQLSDLLVQCGFSPAVRGETLGLAEFALLSNRIDAALHF